MNTQQLLAENKSRLDVINTPFDPVSGQGSPCADNDRFEFVVRDFPKPIRRQWLPRAMEHEELVQMLVRYGTVRNLLSKCRKHLAGYTAEDIVDWFVKVRYRHDYAFWTYMLSRIKNKEGGPDVRFCLNRPQRRLVSILEKMRTSRRPIRCIFVKARQWGGSTLSDNYMAWMALVQKTSWNMIIAGHVTAASATVKGMFDKMLTAYPLDMLYEYDGTTEYGNDKICNFEGLTSIQYIPARNCKIRLGSAVAPESIRGEDVAMAHLTEVALWPATAQRTPQQLVRSVVGSIPPKPDTVVIYESTANGYGNFFHSQYVDAKEGLNDLTAVFVPWFEIDMYSMPFDSPDERREFAKRLIEQQHNDATPNRRAESGSYLWYLWTIGATLEGIHWYISKRSEFLSHDDMAAEYPSDDVEAFVNSGANVFNPSLVRQFEPGIRAPKWKGELQGSGRKGKAAIDAIKFIPDELGNFEVWEKPETFTDVNIKYRYLVVVDIGGRSNKADYSVIAVIDRYGMIDGDRPEIVAQWYGHIDHDLLVWKAAQIAHWYNDALLVIESNTLETKDKERDVDGDQTQFILNRLKDVYDNLYERRQSEEDIREGAPVKYGFHTNVATKPMIISTLVEIVRDHLYVERDGRCLAEYNSYEKKQNGSFGAIIGKHDDILMTRAIGLHICFNEMPMPKEVPIKRPKGRQEFVNAASQF